MSDSLEMRPIPNLPGYFAAVDGTIWSEKKDGRGFYPEQKLDAPRMLKTRIDRAGYLVCGLSDGTKSVHSTVHRLVLLAFHGPPEDGLIARHLNGDRLDNRPENLAWGTHSDNVRDTIRHGMQQMGESHPRAKLTDVQVEDIILSDLKPKEIATKYGITAPHARLLRSGRIWKHVHAKIAGVDYVM